MSFQKGQPRPQNAGRKPGSKNKKKLARVAEFLAEKDINPAAQILSILGSKDSRGEYILKNPKDRADVWLDLLSYCEAKPKAVDESPIAGDLDDFEDVSNEELLRLIKSPGNA